MFLRAGSPVGIVASVRLSDKDSPFGIDCQPEKQRAQRIDCFDKLVGLRVKYVEVSIGDFGVLDDVDDVANRQDVVMQDRMLPRIKRHEVAIDLVATRELCFVI